LAVASSLAVRRERHEIQLRKRRRYRNFSSDYLKEVRSHSSYHSARVWRTEAEWQRRSARRRMRLDGGGSASGVVKERKLRRKLKNPGKKDAGRRADCGVFNLTFSSF